MIREARQTVEEVFAELDEMKKHLNEEDDVSRINAARNELRRRMNSAQNALEPAAMPAEDKKSAREIQKGDLVEILSMGVQAEVLSVSSDRTLTLRAGIMTVTAKENEVYLLPDQKKKQPKKPSSGGGTTLRTASVRPEVDLRGMESIEAVAVAEQYIDSAVMAKLSPITIIHGKGTGALRTAIHQMLRKNKAVKSFRLGNFGEGESGVTIVELK